MATCGGQATIPIVAAVNAVTPVHYGEIVASHSADPGTRANIHKFTETTSSAIEKVGGTARGKAIIVLNPAEPPLIMRDTVHCLVADCATEAVTASIAEMVGRVQAYVPGYRLKQKVHSERVAADDPLRTLAPGTDEARQRSEPRSTPGRGSPLPGKPEADSSGPVARERQVVDGRRPT